MSNYGQLSRVSSGISVFILIKTFFLHIVNGLTDRCIAVCFRSPRISWSVNPPAVFKTNRLCFKLYFTSALTTKSL